MCAPRFRLHIMPDEIKDTPEEQSGDKPSEGEASGAEEQRSRGVEEQKSQGSVTPAPRHPGTPASDQPDAPAEEGAAPPPAAEKPAAPAKDAAKPAPPRAPAAAKPPPPRATAPPGDRAAKPPPAKKGPEVTVEIADDPFIDRIKERFGDAITKAVATHGQQILVVKSDSYTDLCRFLRDDEEYPFDMCSDLTAVHWPDRKGEEFDIVVNLYSVSKNRRLRIKTAIADAEACASVTSIWAGADWMEREAYDMFGIRFEGHPDLRRILLPEDWPGHPLRKEYPIGYQDNEWTDKHLDYREIEERSRELGNCFPRARR